MALFSGGKKKIHSNDNSAATVAFPHDNTFFRLVFFALAALLYYQRDIVWIFNIRLIVHTATIQVSFDVDFNPHSSLC